MCDDGRVRSYRAHGASQGCAEGIGARWRDRRRTDGKRQAIARWIKVQEYLNEVDQERMADAAMLKLDMSRTSSG